MKEDSEREQAESRLSPMERTARRLGRFVNEQPLAKRLQMNFVRHITQPWVEASMSRRCYVAGVDWLLQPPDRGVLVAANHRSFFDMYVAMLSLLASGGTWLRRFYFPVRSNFFYEHPAGMLVNFLVSGGAMYPPIYRERVKAALNRDAVERLVELLARPDTLVGMHPEGTRNKGPDPYQLLPAQPGIGQIVLHARPLVVPLFINGLSNDLLQDLLTGIRAPQRNPVIVVFGKPFPYEQYLDRPPRVALYKKLADELRTAITGLGAEEQALRQKIQSGAIGADDPGWLRQRRTRHRNSAPPA
jgi:1-acyl-sn-glycerol-3-phosphate acyltransferase